MQKHSITYCCPIMQGYVNSGLMTVNYTAGTVHTNIISVSTPEDINDQNPIMTRIMVKYCPNCGSPVVVYSENVPAPTYTRATLPKASCNDVTCRFHDKVNNICLFQYRATIGCYSTDDTAKQAYTDLLASIQLGFVDMTLANEE